MDLDNIYNKGIVKTWFKSTVLDKVNDLRKELGLKKRDNALLDKTYDKEVTDKLSKIDFSSLDQNCVTKVINWSNLTAWLCLNFSGIGFSPDDQQLIGDDNNYTKMEYGE